MRKFLVIVALLLLVVPTACASSKLIEMEDKYQAVINTEAIQSFDILDNTICVKLSYFPSYKNFYYKNSEQAQRKYKELVQAVKQQNVNECLRYGGGKACYIK